MDETACDECGSETVTFALPSDGEETAATLCEECASEVGYEATTLPCDRCGAEASCVEIELEAQPMTVCAGCSHELREEFPEAYGDEEFDGDGDFDFDFDDDDDGFGDEEEDDDFGDDDEEEDVDEPDGSDEEE